MTQAILHWASATHSGSRKPRNDDARIAFASSIDGAELLPETGCRSLETQDLIFAISDGMGGGNAGDLASKLLLETMSRIIPETFKAAAAGFFPGHLEHLAAAVRTVHTEINLAASTSADLHGMAATLALAWFTPENLYLANAGDSRIYLFRNGDLSQLSRDHTTAWGEWKRGTIGEVEYRRHPRRAALYEVIGGGHSTLSPHLAAISYQPGDRFLICSDGLIDGVWERHIANALADCPDHPEMTVDALMKRAVTNSGIDDTTLTMITVKNNGCA